MNRFINSKNLHFMETISKCCAMTTSTKVITIVVSVIIIVAIISLVRGATMSHYSTGIKIMQGVTAGLLTVLMIATVAHTPRQVAVNQEEIKVKLLCRTIHIPVQEVDSVVHYPCGIPSVRLCGAGQFFGHLGLFNSEVCGTYYSFATRNGDVCLIYRKGKKPIAVSVDKPEIFAPFMIKE